VTVNHVGEVLLLLVIMTNFAVLVSDRLSTCIRIMAAQGVLLALLPLTTGTPLGVHTGVLALGTLVIKSIVLPRVLSWAIREAVVRRELEPSIGPITAVALGLAAVAIAFGVATRLPHTGTMALEPLVPVSLASLMMGFVVLTTRRKALSLVIGYLMLENGIYVFGLTLAGTIPFVVELGVLLDVFVGVFIMGLVVFQINRELESQDSRRLTALRD
jgi:hydrogenase-4 component E